VVLSFDGVSDGRPGSRESTGDAVVGGVVDEVVGGVDGDEMIGTVEGGRDDSEGGPEVDLSSGISERGAGGRGVSRGRSESEEAQREGGEKARNKRRRCARSASASSSLCSSSFARVTYIIRPGTTTFATVLTAFDFKLNPSDTTSEKILSQGPHTRSSSSFFVFSSFLPSSSSSFNTTKAPSLMTLGEWGR